MIKFRTLYDMALVGFEPNQNCIFTITTDTSKKYSDYSSSIWNEEFFIENLAEENPKAINLLFIPEEYWDISTDNWIKARTFRKSFLTEKYLYKYLNVVKMYKERYILHPTLSANANTADLTSLLYRIIIGKNMVLQGNPMYPVEYVQHRLNNMKSRADLLRLIKIEYNIFHSTLFSQKNLPVSVGDIYVDRVRSALINGR